MANVNLQTKKIYGCKKGTKTYYHEQAHLLFEDKAPNGNKLRQWQGLSFTTLIYILFFDMIYPLGLWKVLACAFVLVSIGSELAEEVWCWDYANLKLRKKEDDARTKKR